MENRIMEAASSARPTVFNWLGAAVGWIVAWWAGLPPMAQALLAVQGADIVTGVLCAVTGKSHKTASGTISSGALFIGLCKKALEWLAVLVCQVTGAALEMQGIAGAAMAYMMATELVSLIENLTIFGLQIPVLDKILDIAKSRSDSQVKDK